MKRLLTVVLVTFCIVSVISKSISSEQKEDDDSNADDSDSGNVNDSDELPEIESWLIPENLEDFIRKSEPENDQDDIRFKTKDDDNESSDNLSEGDGGTGSKNKIFRWPKRGKVIVPYEIDLTIDYNDAQLRNITHAMRVITAATKCVEFVERNNQKDHIFITRESAGCWSYVGKIGGRQTLNFDFGCMLEVGVLVHELIHVLGFFHMQCHPKRDSFVRINYNNVDSEYEHNFDKLPEDDTLAFDTPYDYFSIMHYGPKYFSNNGRDTIIPRDKSMVNYIGQRNFLSPGDIKRIKSMYGCDEMTKSRRRKEDSYNMDSDEESVEEDTSEEDDDDDDVKDENDKDEDENSDENTENDDKQEDKNTGDELQDENTENDDKQQDENNENDED